MTQKPLLVAVYVAIIFLGTVALSNTELNEQPSLVKAVIDSLILENETIYRVEDYSYRGAGYVVYLSSNMDARGGRRFRLQYSEEFLEVKFESKWLESDYSATKTILVLAPISLSAAKKAVNKAGPLLESNEWITGIQQQEDSPLDGNKYSLEPVEDSYYISTRQVGSSGGRHFYFEASGDSIVDFSGEGRWWY